MAECYRTESTSVSMNALKYASRLNGLFLPMPRRHRRLLIVGRQIREAMWEIGRLPWPRDDEQFGNPQFSGNFGLTRPPPKGDSRLSGGGQADRNGDAAMAVARAAADTLAQLRPNPIV